MKRWLTAALAILLLVVMANTAFGDVSRYQFPEFGFYMDLSDQFEKGLCKRRGKFID